MERTFVSWTQLGLDHVREVWIGVNLENELCQWQLMTCLDEVYHLNLRTWKALLEAKLKCTVGRCNSGAVGGRERSEGS